MTATDISSTGSSRPIKADWRVGERVHVRRRSGTELGRITAIHRRDEGVEIVVRLDGPDGGLGPVVNIWATSRHSSFLAAAPNGGASR